MEPSGQDSSDDKELQELLRLTDQRIGQLAQAVTQRRQAAEDVLRKLQLANIDATKLPRFLDEPFAVLPKAENEWYVIVPSFLDLQVGWLERQTPSFNIFVVNRYADWLGAVPKAIREAVGLSEAPRIVLDADRLLVPAELREIVFKKYRRYLHLREGRTRIRIRPRTRFSLISALIKDGILPFVPKPVNSLDRMLRPIKIELRPYQQRATERFFEFGNIGVYWMPAAGKTYAALYIMNQIKGKKLIVVPSLTLVEQWKARIKELTSIPESEYEVITYNAAKKVLGREYAVAVFDECHHLPANVFSRLALIRTKYRIGLSATPYREDGRNELIFALTGFPVGLDWKELLDLRIVRKPRAHLFVTRNLTSKAAALDDLVRDGLGRRTVIFCDRIEIGKSLAKRYNTSFIYGATKRRLSRLLTLPLVVLSRVGDEGISLAKLERVIEFDFLFGSRRQELQRLGRLFHSNFEGDHYILMTEEEYAHYHKRLFSIYEKGIEIKIEQR